MSNPDQFIVVLGNPLDGFGFIGPFPSRQSAETWMEMHDNDYPDAEWWVAPLFPVRNPHGALSLVKQT